MTMPTPLRFLLGIAVLSVTASVALAADGTWNTTASGNWSDVTKWLMVDPDGDGPLPPAPVIADGAGSTATFAAPPPNTSSPVVTIALDGNRTIGNLYFDGPNNGTTGTHTFTLNGPGILTLAGDAPTITANLLNRTATVNVTLAGTQGVTFTNTGASTTSHLVIGGANTYTGLTQIAGSGFITAANNLAFGSTDGETTIITNNASIRLNNGITISGETLHLRGNGFNGTHGALTTATNASAEWAGNIRLNNGTSRLAAEGVSGVLTISGVISDGTTSNLPSTGNVAIANGAGATAGTVVFSGANTYTGSTTIFRGTLKLDGGNNRLPTGTDVDIVGSAAADNATLNLNGYNQTVASLTRSTGSGTSTLTNSSATASVFTVDGSTSTTYSGNITGNLSLVKAGSSTLNLTGTANTFTGDITVNGGTLGIASAFINDTADVFIADGAIFALNFSGADTISGLYLAGIAQELGTYGAVGSGAQYESAFFAGSGLLNVTAIPEPSTAALAVGALALGLVRLRRRRR